MHPSHSPAWELIAFMRKAALFLAAAMLLGACGLFFTPPAVTSAPPTDTVPPATGTAAAATETRVTATEAPTASAALPTEMRFESLAMIDALAGWAQAYDADGVPSLLRTVDGGRTWTHVTPPDPDWEFDGGVYLDAGTAWAWLFDRSSYQYRLAGTTDGGGTWTVLNDSVYKFDRMVFSSASLGQGLVWGVGAGQAHVSLYLTRDGGAAWDRVKWASSPNGPSLFDPETLHLCNICGDSLYFDPLRVIVTGGNEAMEPSSTFPLKISLDGGQTWNLRGLSLPAGPFEKSWIGAGAVQFFGGRDGWLSVHLATEGLARQALAFYRTGDGGLSWTFQSILETSGRAGPPDFVSLRDAFVSCANDLYITRDGTITWQRIDLAASLGLSGPDGYVRQVTFADSLTGWALAGPQSGQVALYQTADGGLTWVELTPALVP